MFVEDMDLQSYPIKAHSSPEGDRYVDGQRPASHIWRIDYTDSNGYAKWEIWHAERSSPAAQIPYDEIRVLEKRMQKPHKIVAVKFGLTHEQQEPGGPWVPFHPNDKDPRAEKFYEGNFTTLYMDQWRKIAYEGHFDPFKLTRAFSKEKEAAKELAEKDRLLKDMEDRLNQERNKNQALALELKNKGGK
jgi:hypothetical protein